MKSVMCRWGRSQDFRKERFLGENEAFGDFCYLIILSQLETTSSGTIIAKNKYIAPVSHKARWRHKHKMTKVYKHAVN